MEKMTSGSGWSLSSDEQSRSLASSARQARDKFTPTGCVPQPVGSFKIRLEKRVGKYVTVIAGLHTYGADRLNAIAKELKSLCGAGGTVKNGAIEIQGDKVKLVQTWLQKNIK